MISNTLLEAFLSVRDATQTSATKSREISPAFKVSSPEMIKGPEAVQEQKIVKCNGERCDKRNNGASCQEQINTYEAWLSNHLVVQS